MQVEQMTNEELADATRLFRDAMLDSGGRSWTLHIPARMSDPDIMLTEIEARLRNSIPKPVVQLVSGPSSGGYTYTINGREFWTDLDGCDAEFWGAIGVQGVAP